MASDAAAVQANPLFRKKKSKMAKRNGFFMFMVEKRPRYEKDGVKLQRGWAELSELVSDEWQELPQEVKDQYTEKARRFNERKSGATSKDNDDDSGNSSACKPTPKPGQSLAVSMRGIRLAELNKVKYENRSMVYELFFDDWKDIVINVCSFSAYIGDEDDINPMTIIPAEIGLTAFSLKSGVVNNYGRIIVPESSKIPSGFNSTAETHRKKFGLPPFDSDPELADVDIVMQSVESFLIRHPGPFLNRRDKYFVFALDSEFEIVTGCFEWLNKATGHERSFTVLSLSLWAHLASTCEVPWLRCPEPAFGEEVKRDFSKHEMVDLEILAEKISKFRTHLEPLNGGFIYPVQLPLTQYGVFAEAPEVDETVKQMDNYRYYDELCCTYHYKSGDGIHFCALNSSNRYVYSILEVITLINEVEVVAGAHYPEIQDPLKEWARRKVMLRPWGITKMEVEMKDPPILEQIVGTMEQLYPQRRGRGNGNRRGRVSSSRSDARIGRGINPLHRERRGGEDSQAQYDDDSHGMEEDNGVDELAPAAGWIAPQYSNECPDFYRVPNYE